jgi:Kef-type K+ transport system membrane component KefB
LITNVILGLAVIVLTGLLFTKLAKLVRLPNVTGYLVGGLLIGPSVFNIVNQGMLEGVSKYLSEIALGFIAFTIGMEFKFSYFKKVGLKPLIIATFESLFAIVFVFIALMLYGQELPFSLILASIAAATAPAATIMVVKQYKAKGPVTEMLLSVVALDDATAIIFFGIDLTIALQLLNPAAGASMTMAIMKPVFEIVLSFVIGAVIGLITVFLTKWFTGRGNRICAIVGVILLTLGLVMVLNETFGLYISNLLTVMMLGLVYTNLSTKVEEIVPLVERLTPPIFVIFFVISGASLKLNVIVTVGVVGVLYIVFRVLGKFFGSWFGAVISGTTPEVKKYLGWTLIPQAGVAIGLSLIAEKVFAGDPHHYGEIIRAIILCGTLVYELVGPVVSKITLKAAGEITE